MYVSGWTPPKTPEQGEMRIHGGSGDGDAFRPLIALVAAVFLAVAVMFACDCASGRLACAFHAVAQQC